MGFLLSSFSVLLFLPVETCIDLANTPDPARGLSATFESVADAVLKPEQFKSFQAYEARFTKEKENLDQVIKQLGARESPLSSDDLSLALSLRGLCLQKLCRYSDSLKDYQESLIYNKNQILALIGSSLLKSSAPLDAVQSRKQSIPYALQAQDEVKSRSDSNKKVFSKFGEEYLKQEAKIALACAYAEYDNFYGAKLALADLKPSVVKMYLDEFQDARKYNLPSRKELESQYGDAVNASRDQKSYSERLNRHQKKFELMMTRE